MGAQVDIVLRGGTIIDGSGAARRPGDVAIRADRIVAAGELGKVLAHRTIDVSGRIVAPGFIDTHTHDDCALLSLPDMAAKTSQGVTTVIAGNCGVSLAPLVIDGPPPVPFDLLTQEAGWFRFPRMADFVAALRTSAPAVNCALLVGHITLRRRVMGRLDRPAQPPEIDAMQSLLQQSMMEGAIGFSTGLDYPDAQAASIAEIEALVSIVKPFGGIYCSHHRNYFDGLEAALEEVFAIGRTTGVPVVLSHHQATGRENFGKGPMTLAMIERARRDSAIGLDAYPYAASSKTLDPARAKPGVRIMVTWSRPHPEFAGHDLDAIATAWGVSPPQAAQRLLPAGAVYFQLDEADVRAILAYPHTMIGSDGLPHDKHPHPRLWGTFPRVLGRFVREEALVPLEEAVRRMARLPAQWFGFRDRGEIRPGAVADIVVFDPDTVIDRATFSDPIQPATGIELVLVNGEPVWEAGEPTGKRPGRVLGRDPAVAIGAVSGR